MPRQTALPSAPLADGSAKAASTHTGKNDEVEHFIIRHKVKPEHAALNAELVRAVYDELQQANPDGFHYATFQLDDGSLSSTSSPRRTGSDPPPEMASNSARSGCQLSKFALITSTFGKLDSARCATAASCSPSSTQVIA